MRGMGNDRRTVDCLGDLANQGVGFAYPKLPDADEFQVYFSCPGEQRMRRGYASVIDADPLPGTRDRESPFFVHLRFTRLANGDYDDLGRSLAELEAAAALLDFDVDEAQHSLLPTRSAPRSDSFTRVTVPKAMPVMPATKVILPSMLPTPARARPTAAATAMAEDALRPGFFSRCMWQYLTHGARRGAHH